MITCAVSVNFSLLLKNFSHRVIINSALKSCTNLYTAFGFAKEG